MYSRSVRSNNEEEQEADSVSELTDLLAEQASDVNILFCADGGLIPETVLRLRKLLTDAGKTVTLRIC